MTQRRARRRTAGRWWRIAALMLGLLAVWWLFFAPRAETPAPLGTIPGARVSGEPPSSEEITAREKEELQRILRERGAATEE